MRGRIEGVFYASETPVEHVGAFGNHPGVQGRLHGWIVPRLG
jgi:hypothetical protein